MKNHTCVFLQPAAGWAKYHTTLMGFMYGLFIFASWLSLPVYAQDSLCDAFLSAPKNHPYGYIRRGDRCEGIYIQEVSSTTLLVASLTEFFEDYDLTSGKDLLVEWKAPGSTEVRLRAQGVTQKLYYRMDTVLLANSTAYTWPAHILAAMNIRKNDLGVMGWTTHVFGETVQKVHLPLRIRQQKHPVGAHSYQLILVPGRELQEVYISLATVNADGLPETFLKDGEPLEYGYYPAGRGITIPISGLKSAGIYYLEIGATLKGTGVTTVELWFYHRGGQS
jgi:hypothetical protein